MGQEEELKEGVPNESDREDGRKRERCEAHCAATHPGILEAEVLRQAGTGRVNGQHQSYGP